MGEYLIKYKVTIKFFVQIIESGLSYSVILLYISVVDQFPILDDSARKQIFFFKLIFQPKKHFKHYEFPQSVWNIFLALKSTNLRGLYIDRQVLDLIIINFCDGFENWQDCLPFLIRFKVDPYKNDQDPPERIWWIRIHQD